VRCQTGQNDVVDAEAIEKLDGTYQLGKRTGLAIQETGRPIRNLAVVVKKGLNVILVVLAGSVRPAV